jgi:hypothetical protein
MVASSSLATSAASLRSWISAIWRRIASASAQSGELALLLLVGEPGARNCDVGRDVLAILGGLGDGSPRAR